MSSGEPDLAHNRLEITGPADLVADLQAILEQNENRDFNFSCSREPGIGGTDVLKLIFDITEVSVQLISIYLAGNHVARQLVRIKKSGKTVNVSDTSKQDAIEEKIKK